jgi:hypothetical protein
MSDLWRSVDLAHVQFLVLHADRRGMTRSQGSSPLDGVAPGTKARAVIVSDGLTPRCPECYEPLTLVARRPQDQLVASTLIWCTSCGQRLYQVPASGEVSRQMDPVVRKSP